MGKSSGGGGGGAPSGSQTIIQDIAEPFKSFATRSLERAERLQGLPSVPFTGIATAGPTPDELVAAQALRQRFMEADPLTEQALGLQATAADPITAQSIEARRNPFDALIAQEAYRRLDERGQRGLQDLRAREVAAGGTDRGRGAVEASLLRQRQEDQERRIGIESGQRSFTEASRLAEADRQARGDTSIGISRLLGERQALQRRDIDDLLKVGAQFREQFIQPGVDLERQQFAEERGPASTQNPFGFEQFFSGIRAAAPTPTIQTTQQFKQTPSGLSQIAPIVGAGIGVAGQAGAFRAEGGEINFDEGGIASFARGERVLAPAEEQKQVETRLKEFFDHIKNNPNAYEPEVMAELLAMRDEYIEQTTGGGAIASADYADRMRYYQSFVDGITNVTNPGAAKFLARERTESRRPREEGYISQADQQRIAEQAHFSEPGRGRPEEVATKLSPVMQNVVPQGASQRSVLSLADLARAYRESRAVESQADQAAEAIVTPDESRMTDAKRSGIFSTIRKGSAKEVDVIDRSNFAEAWRKRHNIRSQREEADLERDDAVLSSDPKQREDDEIVGYPGTGPVKTIKEPSPPRSLKDQEAVDAELTGFYSNADISAMFEYEQSGRGRENLPRHLRGLDRWEMTQKLKPIREGARKASEPRRREERRERFSNRRSFGRTGAPDVPSYNFEWSDVKEALGFDKGGVASFKKGGVGDMFSSLNPMEGDPVTKALFPEQFEQLQQFKPRFLRGSLDDDEEDEISALQFVENYQESQREAQRRKRRIRNKRRRRETETGLSSLNKGGVASFDKGGTPDFSEYDYGMGEEAMTRGSMLGGKSLPLVHSYEPEGEAVSEKSALTQMDKLMALSEFMNRSAPRDQYYPDAPEMTSGQRGEMLMQAIAGALGAIKADPDTGLTDFSDVGTGAIQGAKGFKGKLEERRASSIALERQQKQDFRQTMTDLQALETSIQSGNKTAMEAQLLEFELKYPEYAAATTAITEMLKAEKQNPFVKHEPIDVGRVMGLLNQIRAQLSGQGATQPSIIGGSDATKDSIRTAAGIQGQ